MQSGLVCSLLAYTVRYFRMTLTMTIQEYENPDMALISIGAASRLLGISMNTLRMYESEGLILPARTPKNQRKYSRRDLARVECIRHAIQHEGMTMNAIKRMIAMIPCWQIKNCSEKDRKNCSAYSTSAGPCWSFQHSNNVCASQSCRDCQVYRLASDCDSIKSAIVNSTRTS